MAASRISVKVLTTPARPSRACSRASTASWPRPAPAGRRRPGHPRHDARDQRADRAQGRAHRADHHRRVPRLDRDRLRASLRAVRPLHGAARPAGAAQPALRRPRAGGVRRLGADAARRGGGGGARAGIAQGARSSRSRSASCTAISIPTHERRAGDDPGRSCCRVCRSRCRRDVCPEIREYERMSTAAANAYIQPLMAGYLGAARAAIMRRRGIPGPLLLMMSSGGMTTVETAVRMPIRLVESGPAGGVIFAQHIAAELGVSACPLDRHGRHDGQADAARRPEAADCARLRDRARNTASCKGSGLPIRIPVIDMVEIGAGGGSIARVDALGRITVGPDSAGAMPGPACYGRGGTEPTVTDADLVLGRIDPDAVRRRRHPARCRHAPSAAVQRLGRPAGHAGRGRGGRHRRDRRRDHGQRGPRACRRERQGHRRSRR